MFPNKSINCQSKIDIGPGDKKVSVFGVYRQRISKESGQNIVGTV
jgi:hypothetical protein